MRLVGFVDADNIANSIYLDFVKSAGLHAEFDRACTFAMRVGEVGDGEFFPRSGWIFGVHFSGITKLRQPLMPIPNLVAERGLVAQFVVEANFNNAMDIAQAFRQLVIRMVMQAPLKSRDDVLAC